MSMGLACGLDGCQGQMMADGFCDTCGRQQTTVGRFNTAAAGSTTAGSTTAGSTTAGSTTAGSTTAESPSAPAGPSCPSCGANRDPQAQFCEACGFDFVRGKSPSMPVARPSYQEPDASLAAGGASEDDDQEAQEPQEPQASREGQEGQEGQEGREVDPHDFDRVDGVQNHDWEAIVETDSGWFARFCETWKAAHGDDCPIAFPGDHRRTVTIAGPVVVIGRHAAGIDLAEDPNDPAVSHRHASLIRQSDGTYALTDLDSSNGTYVRDKPIAKGQTTPIADGDSFTLGAFTRVTLSQLGACS